VMRVWIPARDGVRDADSVDAAELGDPLARRLVQRGDAVPEDVPVRCADE
jgi:hypothetical protein